MATYPKRFIPGTAASPASPARRRLLGAALSASAVLAAPGIALGQRAEKATLRLGYIGPSRQPALATGWALRQGILQKELAPLGFDAVTTHAFANGPDLNEAFLSGALDVGIYGDTPAIVAYSRGLNGRLIGFENVGMNAWLLAPKEGVSSVAELAGKVVAVPLGSYMHRYLLGTLKEAGLGRKVNIVYMLPRDAEPALARGAIAAFAAPIDTGPLLASRGYRIIDEASRHPALLGTSVIVASEKLLAKAPGVRDAWSLARQAALAEMRSDPERYYAFHAEVSGFPVPIVKASHAFSQMPEEPYPPRALGLLNETRKFLLAENLMRRDVDLGLWSGKGAT
ncbi:NitT/TauT family transport system substrate-binding protein/sulfonate transport system substrate-binding protein [Noviherbaspirillum humi]|uniref:NitT/TauT family transport system substrate-binding protein/sulfonate transport system substrate-binding protein n=1 Tax=Noviherbaspirillum humi TaxID=1688639 RepID=A0A239G3V3_9BURK|nr:ABC transporter substrate-binding protein [Noviherbaspirillum humi]SNS63780.1 NitT/TauT family transport system substrate-binding protein/sulfonate transport system substrate-binding protein [Noviherbaspirillum humi]